jgi:hypothetical protein
VMMKEDLQCLSVYVDLPVGNERMCAVSRKELTPKKDLKRRVTSTSFETCKWKLHDVVRGTVRSSLAKSHTVSGRMYRYAVVANFARRIVRNVFMAVE